MNGGQQKAWIWIGAAAVIVVVGILVIWAVQKPASQPTASGPAPSYAPSGQLVAGFPKALVLDQAAQISSSYSINYSASTNQYTAEWNSPSSMASLYGQYKSYFQTNGWKITNDVTKYSASRGLYATKGSAEASVAIMQQGKGSQVIVGYLMK